MKKIIFGLSVLSLSLILVLFYVLFDKGFKINIPSINVPKLSIPKVSPEPTNTMLDELSQDSIDKDVNNSKKIDADGITMGGIKQGVIELSNFKFVPDAIQVNEGDTVVITVKNTQGVHDFVIDEYNVKTKTLKEGESEDVTFVASKKGTFQFYCSIGQHKVMGMVGTMIVN